MEDKEVFLICITCGERTKFFKSYSKKVYADVVDVIDVNADFVDTYSFETEDSDEPHVNIDITCSECDSATIEEHTEEDWVKTIWLHTNKKGNWSKKELPEEKRDKSILQSHLIDKI